METAKACAKNLAAINAGEKPRVFDWDKAAEIIKERGTKEASAGLSQDWEWTGGTILSKGEPVMNDYTYLASNWAIPELEVDGEIIECWKYKEDTEWDCDTKWPKSALNILKGGEISE